MVTHRAIGLCAFLMAATRGCWLIVRRTTLSEVQVVGRKGACQIIKLSPPPPPPERSHRRRVDEARQAAMGIDIMRRAL